MKVLLFILSFVTLSLCQDIVKEIKAKLEGIEIDPEAPYTTFTLPDGLKLEEPHLSLSHEELVFNPRVIIGVDDPSSDKETLLYVKTPMKPEAIQYLLELGAGPKYLLSLPNLKSLALTGVGLVESSLVEPEDLWAEAINSGDVLLFNYLLHDAGADLSYRIRCDRIDFSPVGYCIFKGQIELLKELLQYEAFLLNSPIAVPVNSPYYYGLMHFVNFDEELAAALEPYLENAKWDPSEYTILDMLVLFSSERIPVKTVQLLMDHNVPSKYPLTVAIKSGRCDSKIMSLIRSNPEERAPNFEPPISLLLRSHRNYVPEITELLELGAELVFVWIPINSGEQLKQHQFLRRDHFAVAAKHLIRTGIAAPDEFIYEAVRSDTLDFLRFLLEWGADPHQKIDLGKDGAFTALGYSIDVGRMDMARLILSCPYINLDAPHYWTPKGKAGDFWSVLMDQDLSFVASVFAGMPKLLDSFVGSLLVADALSSLKPSFIPEFIFLLRKRVNDSNFPLETYKQTNADGWSIIDLVAFNPDFSRVVDSDLIRTLMGAGIPSKYPLALALRFFEPHELLPLVLDSSIDPNERTVGLDMHILVLLLRSVRYRIQEIVVLVCRGAYLDKSRGDLRDAQVTMKRVADESLVELRNELSLLIDSGLGTETCKNLIKLIDEIISEHRISKAIMHFIRGNRNPIP